MLENPEIFRKRRSGIMARRLRSGDPGIGGPGDQVLLVLRDANTN